MANFSTSNLLTAQTILNDKYARPEMRMKPSPAYNLLVNNAPAFIAGAETLRTRDDRPIEAHLLARTKRNTTTSRTYNHTGTIDDSLKVTLAWVTKADKTSISLKLLDKSVFDFNTVLANKLEQCMMNIIEDYETAAIAYLLAQRSQYSASLSAGASFNAATDVIEIAANNKPQFYQILKSALRRNKYSGQLDIIADSSMYVSAEYQAAQGAGNQNNLAFQFNGMNIVESIELADINYPNGIVLATPAQSVGGLTWIPKQNRTGWGDYNSYVGGYGVIKDPWYGLSFALHGYAQRANTSASNGDTQDVQMEFELSLDTSFNVAPLSTTNAGESVVFESAIAGA